MSYWWFPIFFLASLLLTGVLRFYAIKLRLVDFPNKRSSHVTPTPRGGGVAVVLVFFAGSILLYLSALIPANIFLGVCLGGGCVALVGFIDDHRPLSARIRIAVHVFASLLSLFLIYNFSHFTDFTLQVKFSYIYLFVLVGLVWSLNLYNFMDGIDGISGVEAITLLTGIAFILWFNGGNTAYIQWLLILSVSTLGFLVWNWPPAKIFMGDACSGFLGYCIGIFAIITSEGSSVSIWSWLILYGVFVVDATVTLLRRILIARERFYEAHRSHTYQILSRRLNSHQKITLGVLAINLFWLLPLAFLASRFSGYGSFYTLIAYLPLVAMAIKIGAGTTNN